jgi:hypothetical protein
MLQLSRLENAIMTPLNMDTPRNGKVFGNNYDLITTADHPILDPYSV